MVVQTWRRFMAVMIATGSGAFLVCLGLVTSFVNAEAAKDTRRGITSYPAHVVTSKGSKHAGLSQDELTTLAMRTQTQPVRIGAFSVFTSHRGEPILLRVSSSRAIDRSRLTSGRVPQTQREVLVPDFGRAFDGQSVGDQLSLQQSPMASSRQFTIVGTYSTKFSVAGDAAPLIYVDDTSWPLLLPNNGIQDFALVTASGDSLSKAALETIVQEHRSSHRMTSGAEYARWSQRPTRSGSILQTFIYVFVVIALVTLFFLVSSMFRILSASRRRDVQLLRTLGASRWSTWCGLARSGLSAGLVGIAVGVGLAVLATAGTLNILAPLVGLRLDMPLPVTPFIWAAILVTVVVTVVVAADSTSLASAHVPQASQGRRRQRLRRCVQLAKPVIGMALAAASAVAMVLNEQQLVGDVAAGMLMFLGVVWALPVLVSGLLLVGNFLARRMGSVPVELSTGALLGSLKRTVGTVTTVLLGTVLVSSMLVGVAALNNQVGALMRSSSVADLVVEVPEGHTAATVLKQLRDHTSLGADLRFAAAGKTANITYRDKKLQTQGTFYVFAGQTPWGQIALADNKVYTSRGDLGDSITVTAGEQRPDNGKPEGSSTVSLQVVVSADAGPHFTVSAATLERLGVQSKPTVFAYYDSEFVLADKADHAFDVFAARDGFVVSGAMAKASSLAGLLDRALIAALVLLSASLVVATIGVVAALVFSVAERRREFALLRSVGGDRATVVATVVGEGIVLALLTVLISIPLGVWFGSQVAASALKLPTIWTWPSGYLVVFAIATAIVCTVASALPARQAVRVDVAEAMSRA